MRKNPICTNFKKRIVRNKQLWKWDFYNENNKIPMKEITDDIH
jgi:hypothetical protein